MGDFISGATLPSLLGLVLLGLGLFLLLAGFQIIKIEKISVTPGRPTVAVGIILTLVGLILFLPEMMGQRSAGMREPEVEEPAPQKEYLSMSSPREVSVGYGALSIGKYLFTSDPVDRINAGDVIRAHGVEYPNRLFAHAPSRVVYDLERKYSELEAVLAVVEWEDCGDGAVYVVKVDGDELYRSGRIFGYSEPVRIRVNISRGQTMELITETGDADDYRCDWTVWGDPTLYR